MFRSFAKRFAPWCLLVAACDDPIFSVDASLELDGAIRREEAEEGWPAQAASGDFESDSGTGDKAGTSPLLDAGDPGDSGERGSDAAPDAVAPFDPCAAQAGQLSASPPAVALGDFDKDGEPDVVVGDPRDDNGRGAVCFYSGALWSSTGALDTCRRWTQADDTSGVAEPGDHCGQALAVGDFDGDGVDDLAIGCPGESFEHDEPEAGQLTIVFGKAGFGPDFARTQTIDQSHLGRNREAYDHFTISLAAADFDADGISDLAMGAPNESTAGPVVSEAGVVMLLSGKARSGLDPATYVGIGQTSLKGLDVPGVVAGRDDTHEAGDLFGSALAAANLSFGGVVRPTLIVGVPGEDNGKGAVSLLAGGTSAGLGVPAARAVLSAPAEAGAGFGRALTAMGTDRVLVGAPYAHEAAGAVWVFKIEADNWASPTLVELRKGRKTDDLARPNDLFGYSLFATPEALLVGTPGEDPSNGKVCNEGSVERFDAALLNKPALVGQGRLGFGVALSGFRQAAGKLVTAVSASDAAVLVQPLTD